MKQRKIAVIAGTSDATDWIRSLPETDSVTAFVATPYGKEILAGTNCTVHVGRLDAAGFAEALTGFDLSGWRCRYGTANALLRPAPL